MRKEVNLSEKTISSLQELANEEGRSLKQYMELILTKHADGDRLKVLDKLPKKFRAELIVELMTMLKKGNTIEKQ